MMPAPSRSVLPMPWPVPVDLKRCTMESTCDRGVLRRQLSHFIEVWNGMPDTESAVMTTACHFSTLPPLQIKTGSEESRGVG